MSARMRPISLLLGNEEITFQARFNGVAFPVVVPIDAVAAIYAKENAQGMAFEVQTDADVGTGVEEDAVGEPTGDDSTDPSPKSPAGRPRLTRVK